MSVLVTGGAGFIGSNLVRGLNEAGVRDVVVSDDLHRSEKLRNLSGLSIADYYDKSELIASLPKLAPLDAIFHQGACATTTEPDGRYLMANNFSYSKALLHFAINHEIPFFYASSAAVYGDGRRGFEEREECEDPLNVYAYSKLQFDNYVRRLPSTVTSPVAGLRYFNVYGPREAHKGRMASVAFHLHGQHARGEAMKLFEGSDSLLRDFVFVDDVVRVNLFLWQHRVSGLFNCGTGKARSFGDVGRLMQRHCAGARLESIPFPPDLQGKYQRFTEASLARLRAAGFDGELTSLEDGLRRYAEHLVHRSSPQ
ncbi:MAG: ADP-glyceromanno-heptose 6-epimerase [Polyangiales bacterium]